MPGTIDQVPPPVREFLRFLPEFTYCPMDYPKEATPNRQGFVTIVGQVEDSDVLDLDDKPMVEIRLAPRVVETETGKQILLIWLFLLLKGKSEEYGPYGIPFNLGEPSIRDAFSTLSQQPHYEIVSCGRTIFTATRVELPTLKADMANILEQTKELVEIGWSHKEYMSAMHAQWERYRDSKALMDSFQSPSE